MADDTPTDPTDPASSAPPRVSVQVALGAAGAEPTVEWKGAAYRLGPPTQKAKSLFEDGVVEAERRAIDEGYRRKFFTAAERTELLRDLGRAVDRGDHAVGGPLWQRYAIGEELAAGQAIYLWTLFAQNHPELTVPDVRQLIEDVGDPVIDLMVKRVVPSFFDWLGGLPNMPPAVAATLRAKAAEVLGQFQTARVVPTA